MTVLDALKRDVAATVGADHGAAVDRLALHGRSFIEDDQRLLLWLIDEVQQYFHDTFVDVTWPACPRHPNHPLWFKEGWWWCERDGAAVARLGDLVTTAKAR